MQNNLRTLGPSEALVVLSLQEQGRTVVRPSDLADLLGSETKAHKVGHNLVRKGWLNRIVGGRYMFIPSDYGPENLGENNILAMAGAAVEPSYIGWWNAASWHGFTTQKPMTVTVATNRQVPVKVIDGTDVRFVKLTERKFFDFHSYEVYGRKVFISSPAKTLIDCIDRPDLCGGASELTRIAYAALGEIDLGELVQVALRFKSKAVMQRLGFLSDLTGRPLPNDIRETLRSKVPASYRSYFGRSDRKDSDVGYVHEWGLFVHANESDLLSEVMGRRAK